MLRALWSVAASPYRRARYYTSTKHDLPFARPGRTPPDPAFFPRYIQNKQGIWLHFVEFPPLSAPKPKGVIFLVMGLGEHAGRYDSVALRSNDEGYYVFMMDNQGHGASEGERRYVENFSDYIDDVQLFVKTMFAKHPELASLPRFIVGHSMGAVIATLTAYRDPKYWNGVILSGPAFQPSVQLPSAAESVVRVLAKVAPKVGYTNLNYDLVNCNPAVVEFVRQDPLIPRNLLKFHFVIELLDAVKTVYRDVDKSKYPLFIAHGVDDGLCKLEGAKWMYDNCVSADKELQAYPGLFHDVLHFPQVQKDYVAFLNAHCSPRKD